MKTERDYLQSIKEYCEDIKSGDIIVSEPLDDVVHNIAAEGLAATYDDGTCCVSADSATHWRMERTSIVYCRECQFLQDNDDPQHPYTCLCPYGKKQIISDAEFCSEGIERTYPIGGFRS